jgi:hypothetical protein
MNELFAGAAMSCAGLKDVPGYQYNKIALFILFLGAD